MNIFGQPGIFVMADHTHGKADWRSPNQEIFLWKK